jgi:hypothetical protein
MTSQDPRSVFEAFIRAANSRDIAALEKLVHPEFQDFYPQTGEMTRGFANLRAIIENYPSGGYAGKGTDRVVGTEDHWVVTPTFSMLRIEGAGDTFTGISRGRYPDGSDWYVVNICQIRNGLVWRSETFFAPLFEAPAWRSEWVEVKKES